MKVCSKCKESKGLEEFNKNSKAKDGLRSQCKDCEKEYEQNNKEKIAERKKKYNQKNKVEIAKRNKDWRLKNRPELLEKKKQYYEKNKEKIAEHDREYRKKNPYQIQSTSLSSSARKRAKQKNIPIDLDFISTPNMLDWLKRQPNCVCCDRVFGIGYKGKFRFQNNSPSLDRLIPSLGYISGNVFLICFRCNALKNDATLKELETVLGWMKKTENYLNRFNYSVEEE